MVGAMAARILVVDDSPTIRKVVAAILTQQAYDPVLAEDGHRALELLREESVDLVLLDFVMPRMNGYQFCRQLRASPKLKELPVVLMSAKSDRIRGRFVQQTGAIDAITKPFDARGLVAVVEGALRKHAEGRTRPVPDAAAMPEEEMLQDSSVVSLPPSAPVEIDADPGGEVRSGALAALLGDLIAPVLKRFPFADQIRRAIMDAITPQVTLDVAAIVGALQGPSGREALAGDISVISVAEVLQVLQLQRQSGELVVSSHGKEITMFVREGFMDFATSQGLRGKFLLGRYLVDDGAIGRGELEQVLAGRAEGKPSGELLADLGLVTPSQIRKALVRQTMELVFECVRWNSGRFGFTVGKTSPESEKTRLGLPIGGLVVEGFRRVDEWRLIEGSFDFGDVLYRDQAAVQSLGDQTALTKLERAVLGKVDGERTVREIIDQIEGSSFDLSKVIFQLLNSRLAKRSHSDG
jgi:CheY-like chemotaxis protein